MTQAANFEERRETLPEPWRDMLQGREEDEKTTILIGGQPFMSGTAGELVEDLEEHFNDPRIQARLRRVQKIVARRAEEGPDAPHFIRSTVGE